MYFSPWTDLSALGDARGLERLALFDNPVLLSLAGAQLPERLELLALQDNPVLANLDGLETLRSIDRLSISTVNEPFREPVESQLTSVEGLSALERVVELSVYGQTRLRSLTGLGALREIERLEFRTMRRSRAWQDSRAWSAWAVSS
ncbi:MAG: hypothetical protein ABI895_29310 [Deltaproteobacteria bacterium]